MCYGHLMMMSSMPLLVLALTTALAAPAAIYEDYVIKCSVNSSPRLVSLRRTLGADVQRARLGVRRKVPNRKKPVEEQVPQKRAALVLDRLLVALQKALHEEGNAAPYERTDRDGPRTAPLRIADEDLADMSALERRGQTVPGRGRVLRCYFNAVTCF